MRATACYPLPLRQRMSKEIYTPRHEALRRLIKLERQRNELSQAELAERLGWDQTTVTHIETGSKRVTVIELIELSEVLGFNLCTAMRRVAKVRN
jgi:transcriptional regulator with XRE-family HTH domain